MLRKEWKFDYAAGTVLEGATEKYEHHRARQAHWQGEMDRTVEEIKERGILVEERPARGMGTSSYHVSGRIDPALEERLDDAQRKRDEHRAKGDEYERWVDTLFAEHPQRVLQLDSDDIAFFALASRRAVSDEPDDE